MALRASYFIPGSRFYYRPYFDPLGKMFSSGFGLVGSPQEIFQRYVFKSDCVPWLSKSIRGIDFSKVKKSKHDGIVAHAELLRTSIRILNPRWIQINGVAHLNALSDALGLCFAEPRSHRKAHFGRSLMFDLPVLAHHFGKPWLLGPSEFTEIAMAFRSYVGNNDLYDLR